ncbi:MAG: anti-sigma factor antagonist [Calditrichaeota bacterium]|nr:MAG: anti-sigma factor antagonist [Calditrichota bacterium]
MLKINTKQVDTIMVLSLRGRVDVTTVNELREAVKKLSEEGYKNFVFDMGRIDFIDSIGLGALVTCLRIAVKNDGDVKLAKLQGHVRAIVEITRLHKLFDIFEDVESAIKAY